MHATCRRLSPLNDLHSPSKPIFCRQKKSPLPCGKGLVKAYKTRIFCLTYGYRQLNYSAERLPVWHNHGPARRAGGLNGPGCSGAGAAIEAVAETAVVPGVVRFVRFCRKGYPAEASAGLAPPGCSGVPPPQYRSGGRAGHGQDLAPHCQPERRIREPPLREPPLPAVW
jgi:hypothetical protein